MGSYYCYECQDVGGYPQDFGWGRCSCTFINTRDLEGGRLKIVFPTFKYSAFRRGATYILDLSDSITLEEPLYQRVLIPSGDKEGGQYFNVAYVFSLKLRFGETMAFRIVKESSKPPSIPSFGGGGMTEGEYL